MYPTTLPIHHQLTAIIYFICISNISNLSDFNFPDINRDILSVTSPVSINYIICDLIFNICQNQLIVEPTHIHGNVLDLLLMKKKYSFLSVQSSLLCHPIIMTFLLQWLLSISSLPNLHLIMHLIIPKVTTLVSAITYSILTLKL